MLCKVTSTTDEALSTVLILLTRPAALALLMLAACAQGGGLARMLDSRPSPKTVDPKLEHQIVVPLDRDHPTRGKAEIRAEFGAPYDVSKPTVFVIADAQQFYVRPGAAAELQRERFGDALNVVAIMGRNQSSAFLDATRTADGQVDWQAAWDVFEAREWIEDIETVRRQLLGSGGSVSLYGQSGGALLVHQYLAVHGAHVQRSATPAALNPFLVGELGLRTDRFWFEVGRADSTLQSLLRDVLRRNPADRTRLAMTFQRQNFFVEPSSLAAERMALIRSLASGDGAAYDRARRDYQVEDVLRFLDSPAGVPIRVRLFEFVLPSQATARLRDDELLPDVENQRAFAEPLLQLYAEGRIPVPTWDRAGLHRLTTQVLVVAGVEDHTVDYRAAIALASIYPRGHLFLARDDHQFHAMAADGSLTGLVRTFLGSGPDTPEFFAATREAARHRWDE